MPIYGPPTPPLGDDDVYIDHATSMLYDTSSTIPDHLLPRVWQGPKKNKGGSVTELPPVKTSVDDIAPDTGIKKNSTSAHSSASKVTRRDEPIFAPRSLFDRPSPALAKLRRDYKIQKLSKTGSSRFPGALSVISTQPLPKTLGPGAISFPITVPKVSQLAPTDILEWTVPEDHVLLQSMTTVLELPPNLLIVNLAQTPNWDFATEFVNAISRIHRSQKQCRMRYEQVILPREEGKYVEPVNLPKKKKAKSAFIKLSPPPAPPKGRTLKTSEIVANDNNTQYKNIYVTKFSKMMSIPKARKDITPPVSSNSNHHTARGLKQHAVFAEHNINFETPVAAPILATVRFDRLIAERNKQIANQRAQQAGLAAAVAAARGPTSLIRIPSPQNQQVQTVVPVQEHLVQTHGAGIVEYGANKTSPPATVPVAVISSTQATPTLISSLTQPPRGVHSVQQQPLQPLPPRAALIPVSRAPIQIHQSPSIQTQQTITTHQRAGQTLILSSQPQQQHTTIVSSAGTGPTSGFPIVIPVSSTSMVRGLIHQTNQHLTQPPASISAAHRFVIAQRETVQPQQLQLPHSRAPAQQPILLTSSPAPTTLHNPMCITPQTPILVSSCGISPSTGIVVQHQATAGLVPRSQTFIHPGSSKQQQIQINSQPINSQSQPKQVFITQQGDGRELVTIQQTGPSHSIQSPNSQATTCGGIISQQKLASLVADSLVSSSNIITIPNKSLPPPGGQSVVRATAIPGGHVQIAKAGQLPTGLSEENFQMDTIPNACTSPNQTLVKAVPMLPVSVTGPTGMSSPEYTRAVTMMATGGSNIVVQLAGVPPGAKLTQSQIQQLRQSILQQSPKAYVNVITSTSPQQIRPDARAEQQLKKIHILPTTQTNLLTTNASPQNIALVTMPTKYTTAPRQPVVTPVSVMTDFQKAQSYGLVSTMAVSPRNPNQTTRLVGTPPHSLFSQPLSYRRSPTLINTNTPVKDNTIHVTTRPLVATSTNPNVKTQLFTPVVSQIPLVRGTVPFSSNPITVTTIPVTYSATKTSLLRQPVPVSVTGAETTLRPQLVQRQILSTPVSPASQVGPTLLVAKGPDPPQLIMTPTTSYREHSTSGVFTIYTTTPTTSGTATPTTQTTPSRQSE